MDELAEMLRDAQAAGGPSGFGGDGFAGFRGGPSALPPVPGPTQPGNIPAAFGKRRKKKEPRYPAASARTVSMVSASAAGLSSR